MRRIIPEWPTLYHDGNRELQDRFDTRRLADRLEERILRDTFDDDDRAFIEARDMFFLATADEHGMPQCSYKGGEPGFVRVVDEHTLAFPSYDGNGMYLSLGNLLVNPQVGILFIDFARPKRLRVNGIASIDDDDPLLAEYAEAQLIVRVRARDVLPTAPATCTGWSSSSTRASSPTTTTRRRSRTGSGASGRTTCCRRGIRRPPRDLLPEWAALPTGSAPGPARGGS